MSPLTSNRKSRPQNNLREPASGVDRELDSKKPIPALKTTEINTPQLPPDLAAIVSVWPDLPDHIKAAIKTLVQSVPKQG